MDNTILTSEILLSNLLIAIEEYIATHMITTSVESFLEQYPIVSFVNGDFAFAISETSSIFTRKYVTPFYTDATGKKCMYQGFIKEVYESLMPFLNFYVDNDALYTKYVSKWYSSEKLFKLLPTRKNIINQLLENL